MDNKIIGAELDISNGYYRIAYGDGFEVDSAAPFMCYTENNIWHAVSDPERERGIEAVVLLPKECRPEFIKVKAVNAGIYSEGLNAGTVELELKECITRFRTVTARRVIISAVRGDNKIMLRPSIGADISCGFGSLKAELCRNIRGYHIDAFCGAGRLVIDGVRTGRTYRTGDADGIKVNVKCGLGDVVIKRQR